MLPPLVPLVPHHKEQRKENDPTNHREPDDERKARCRAARAVRCARRRRRVVLLRARRRTRRASCTARVLRNGHSARAVVVRDDRGLAGRRRNLPRSRRDDGRCSRGAGGQHDRHGRRCDGGRGARAGDDCDDGRRRRSGVAGGYNRDGRWSGGSGRSSCCDDGHSTCNDLSLMEEKSVRSE